MITVIAGMGWWVVMVLLLIVALMIKGVSEDNCCHGEGHGDIEAHSDRSSNFGSDGSIGG